jgi:F420-dependent oxidoreductase-like protein
MIEIAIMLEGQNGLNWPRFQKIAQAVEDLGFAGLYRSDHYTNANPPDIDSLEAWVSLTWLASHTKRIEFGPLVSPLSFRDPTMLARMASAVDDLSGGRLTLGLGAGWQEREHEHYGWQLLDIPGRFKRFEDGLEIVTRLLKSDTPVTYSGQYYSVKDAVLLPRPQRKDGPPILIGGNGEKLTLPKVVKYASEWNATFRTPADYAALSTKLTDLLAAAGRNPASVKRSMMTNLYFGKDVIALAKRLVGKSVKELMTGGVVAGTPSQVVDQLGAYADAGVQRIMLQWLDLDDMDGLEAFAKGVLSQIR